MTTLIESKARPFGSSKGTLISLAIHGAVIAAAVFATTEVVLPPREKVEEHPILYVAPPPPKPLEAPPAPLPKAPTPPKAQAQKVFKAPPPAPKRAPTPPRPTPVVQPKVASTPAIVAPPSVPTNIPKIDLKGIPTVSDVVVPPAPEAVGKGVSTSGSVRESDDGEVGGSAGGRKGGLSSGASGKAYDENQVDTPVQVSRKVDPRYPDALKSVGVQGTVVMRFIVGADGKVEPGSIEAVSSPNSLFTSSVRNALLQMRFRAAEAGGQKVRQLVEQPFSFVLQ